MVDQNLRLEMPHQPSVRLKSDYPIRMTQVKVNLVAELNWFNYFAHKRVVGILNRRGGMPLSTSAVSALEPRVLAPVTFGATVFFFRHVVLFFR